MERRHGETLERKPLDGRVAVVTGAGRGIGRAAALAVAHAGATVVAMARSAGDLAALCDELPDGQCIVSVGDVTREQDVANTFGEAQVAGDVSILVHAAGAAAFGPTVAFDLDDWIRVMDTNLTGAFLCCREAARAMGEEGHIINIGSIAGQVAMPNSLAYCASKWGLAGLTKSLAAEMRATNRHGIRVTLLSPGSTDTPLWDGQGWAPPRQDMLRPEDVAAAVLGILTQPAHVATDELLLMPAKGIL